MQFNWKKTLSPGEEIRREFGISKTYSTAVLILTVLIAVLTWSSSIFAGTTVIILGLVYWIYITHSKHYAFTNKRIVLVDFFLGLSTISIDYNQITDIQIEQSFVEQILGFGTFIVNTSSTHTPQTKLPFVSSPSELKQTLDQIRDVKTKA